MQHEKWYCPQCGPTTTYQYWCGESDTLFTHCTGCQGLDLSKETPVFVHVMQERIKALEAENNRLEKAWKVMHERTIKLEQELGLRRPQPPEDSRDDAI